MRSVALPAGGKRGVSDTGALRRTATRLAGLSGLTFQAPDLWRVQVQARGLGGPDRRAEQRQQQAGARQ